GEAHPHPRREGRLARPEGRDGEARRPPGGGGGGRHYALGGREPCDNQRRGRRGQRVACGRVPSVRPYFSIPSRNHSTRVTSLELPRFSTRTMPLSASAATTRWVFSLERPASWVMNFWM